MKLLGTLAYAFVLAGLLAFAAMLAISIIGMYGWVTP